MSTKLLIVDDQSNARDLIRSFLTIPGMSFHECASGHEAVAAVRDFKPHWITMDVKMPGMNGFEAIRAIKKAHPEGRVIIVTSFNEPQFRDLAVSAGAVGFILKENLLALRLLLEKEHKAAGRSNAPATPKRILLLDDESETHAALALLADKGYHIVRAASGAEAAALHRENPFDLVIIELLLPEYNGFEAFAELRRTASPPKFIATAKAEWATAEICLRMAKQLGADEILAKPFPSEELLGAVEKILK